MGSMIVGTARMRCTAVRFFYLICSFVFLSHFDIRALTLLFQAHRPTRQVLGAVWVVSTYAFHQGAVSTQENVAMGFLTVPEEMMKVNVTCMRTSRRSLTGEVITLQQSVVIHIFFGSTPSDVQYKCILRPYTPTAAPIRTPSRIPAISPTVSGFINVSVALRVL